MSLPTPETLPRHELAGLQVEVVDAPNPDAVGIAGRVVGETTRTLRIEGADGGASRVRQVPKSGATFEFALTDEAAAAQSAGTTSKPGSETAGAAGSAVAGGSRSAASGGTGTGTGPGDGTRNGEGVAYVTVDGARLVSRPARRTETGGVSKWR